MHPRRWRPSEQKLTHLMLLLRDSPPAPDVQRTSR
jgi:hypothetical protein